MPASPGVLPFHRRLVLYGLWAISQVVVAFLLLEIVGRIFDPLGISYYPDTAAYMDTMIVEDPVGYRNRPNLKGRYYGVPVAINSIGLREREIPEHHDASEFRILVFGDSVPFGIGVEYEQAIPHQLETTLNSHRTGPRFRTVNMGTISYNTEQELTQLKALGLKLDPNLVVLMYMENDVQPKMWIFDKRRHWYVDVAQRSYAACLLAVLYKTLTGLGPVGAIDGGEYGADSPGWRNVERCLIEFYAICRAHGLPLVVFSFPRNPLVEEVGSHEGFPVISLWDDPAWGDAKPWDYANSVTDGHPNPEGSRIIASLMFQHLARLNVLPPAAP